MTEKITIKIDEKNKELNLENEGKTKLLRLPLKITVQEKSFLHIGSAPSPLTEKKGAVFKVDRTPVIPASTFKGALRNQLELLLLEKADDFAKELDINNEKDKLKPCIPSTRPTKAEKELTDKYRKEHCEIKVDENIISVKDEEWGLCPVCYFMGATGIMGFLRIDNFYPSTEGNVIDQTNIRIDRKTQTAAKGAKLDGEQVKPGTIFKGNLSVVISEPMLEIQGFQFGDSRKIGDTVIDKWLEKYTKSKDEKAKYLIERILIPAIKNINLLGGQKSKGCGKVKIEVI